MSDVNQLVTILDSKDAAHRVPLTDLLFLRGEEMRELLYGLGYNMPFRDPVYGDILKRLLSRIPGTLDKRQGSVIYDTLAAAAYEMTQLYLEREASRALMFVSTARGAALDKKVFEQGVQRTPATPARRMGHFWADAERTKPFAGTVPVGAVYSLGLLNFTVKERRAAGQYLLTCDVSGSAGNAPGGELVPVEYIQGLAVAELGEVLVPGEDEESDDALYARWLDIILRPPFGGNRSDYEDYLRRIDGVGPVRLFRAMPEAGHVTIVLLGADGELPATELVSRVQEALDPIPYGGEGIGMAPMCHDVHVLSAQGVKVDVSARITLADGLTIGQVSEDIRAAAEGYLLKLRMEWGAYTEGTARYNAIIVRQAQLESAILAVGGVVDIEGMRLNGQDGNLYMVEREVPFLGEVDVYE